MTVTPMTLVLYLSTAGRFRAVHLGLLQHDVGALKSPISRQAYPASADRGRHTQITFLFASVFPEHQPARPCSSQGTAFSRLGSWKNCSIIDKESS